jgi:hypothetical protein
MTATLLDEIGSDYRMFIEAAEIVTRSRGMNRETFRRRMLVGHLKAARLLDLLDRCQVAALSGRGKWAPLVSAHDLLLHLARLRVNPADAWNAAHPVGTAVRYWSGYREGEGRTSRTRTPAWMLGSDLAVVSVDGHSGGIALTHVEPIPAPATSLEH